jgi:hypothetical protein
MNIGVDMRRELVLSCHIQELRFALASPRRGMFVSEAGLQIKNPMTDEAIETILSRVSDAEAIRNICADPDLPSREAWRVACRADPALAARYAAAVEEAAHTVFGEIIDIADTEEDPQKARNRIDARKWVAARLSPKYYGERQKVDVTLDVGAMSDDAMGKELAMIVGVRVAAADPALVAADSAAEIEEDGA